MLYALTIFVSAFLLFQVQPLMGRLVLPWFGGSAAVWTACLLFFQVVLLAGYLYAYAMVRWCAPRRQTRLHLALLLVSLIFLPLWPWSALKPQGTEDPTLRILLLLGTTVGLPYMLLASTSPLLQAWYVRLRPDGSPYRLFALSNLGSMLALISYVAIVEPRFSLRMQSFGWSAGYGLFMAGAALCALRSLRGAEDFGERPPPSQPLPPHVGTDGQLANESIGAVYDAPPTLAQQLVWLALASCASVLLIALTHQVTQNVPPIPFLWVAFLCVYLLSFILCFEGHNLYWRWLYYPLLAVVLFYRSPVSRLSGFWRFLNGASGLTYFLMSGQENTSPYVIVPVFLASFFVLCMVCHGELARLRPSPRYLTTFYLMCSLGGALGGIFTGVIAPHIFPAYFETHFALVACPFLLLVIWFRDPRCRLYRLRWCPVWIALMSAVVYLAWFLSGQAHAQLAGHVLTVRNFYGVLIVNKRDAGTASERMELTNGTIRHGEQFTSPSRRREPTTYYGQQSGVGVAINATRTSQPQRVGVVGLGAGTVAAYGRDGDLYRFYEINPMVVNIARHYFTYLADAPQRVQIVMGDARLNLEREPPQSYDVLAIDAFSSDAIPIHLLTVEAFAQYFRHLSPKGILAVHVSNSYLNLEPVVTAAASYFGHRAVRIENEDDDDNDLLASSWVLVARNVGAWRREPFQAAGFLVGIPGFRTWTDDYTNVISILRRHGGDD